MPPVAAAPRVRARAFAVVTAVLALFLAAAAAPTPLYAFYAREWGFAPGHLTAVFAVYALALLAALLVAGSLSDAVGRRPVVAAGLVGLGVSLGLFVAATGLAWLYAARVVQGLATGLVTAALAAALIDLQAEPGRGALVNAVTPTFGLAAGALLAGALVEHGPAPTRTTYLLLLAVTAGLLAALPLVPETVAGRSRPRLRVAIAVDPDVRPAFLAALPCLVATWALGGLYLSLGPSVAYLVLGGTDRLLGGAVVALLCTAGGLASLGVRSWEPRRAMVAGCAALAAGAGLAVAGLLAGADAGPVLLVAGTAVAGTGFGAGFLGAFRALAALASPERRGGLVAAVYVVAYLAFGLPAVAAGLVAGAVGLRPTAVGYATAVAALALLALLATRRAFPEPARVAARPPGTGTS